MRRTTTSPATFFEKALFAALVMAAAFVACGKRGDPLPPLRPIPAPAEAFTIRQVGDVIRLEWTAPSANQDRTTENVLLRDVDIRRRIIDLPALIEEQTKIIEPKEPKEPGEGEPGEGEPGEGEPGEGEPGEGEPGEGAKATIDPLTGEPVDAAPETESDEELPPTGPDPPDEEEQAEDTVDAEEPVIDVGELLEQSGLVAPDALDRLGDPEALATEPPEDPGPPPLPLITIPNFAPSSRPLVTLESTVLGERMSYDDPIDPVWIGQRVEYAVIYTNQKNRRGPRSTVLQIDPAEALPPPGAPVAKPEDLLVALSWPAPPNFPAVIEEAEADLDTAEIDEEEETEDPDTDAIDEEIVPDVPHYAVFRRAESDESYPDRPLNGQPTPMTTYSDRTVAFDVASCYVIRTVPPPPPVPVETADELAPESIDEPSASEPETTELEPPEDEPEPLQPLQPLMDETSPEALVEPETAEPDPLEPVIIVPVAAPLRNEVRLESAASPEVCLTPVDTFALPPPTGLVGVSAGNAILLTWDESPRPDAAGYRIYRGENDGGPFELLNEELLTAPTFRDGAASPGVAYLYYVTAVDDAPAQNESEASEYDEVTLTPP